MKQELQQALQTISQFTGADSPQYEEAASFFVELDKYPKRDWNTVSDKIKEGLAKPPTIIQKVLVKVGL